MENIWPGRKHAYDDDNSDDGDVDDDESTEIWVIFFLGATKQLYNWLCPLVGQSVGYAFVRRSTRRTLLAYLALFPS